MTRRATLSALLVAAAALFTAALTVRSFAFAQGVPPAAANVVGAPTPSRAPLPPAPPGHWVPPAPLGPSGLRGFGGEAAAPPMGGLDPFGARGAGQHVILPPGVRLPGMPGFRPVMPPPAPASNGPLVAFWVFACLAIAGTLGMVTRRKPVSAVLCLVGAFAAQAGIYVLLFAPFLATLQVLVYAGAIMVLFVFVIMLLNREEPHPVGLRALGTKAVGVFAAAYLVTFLAYLIHSPRAAYTVIPAAPPSDFGSVAKIGEVLFSAQSSAGGMQTDYLVPFELVSLVLLVAIIGALVVARPVLAARKARTEDARGAEGSPAPGPAERIAEEAHG